jgi:hypothetical protein
MHHAAMLRVSIWMLVIAMVGCVGADDSSTSDAGTHDGGIDAASDGAVTHCVFGASHFGDGCQFGP